MRRINDDCKKVTLGDYDNALMSYIEKIKNNPSVLGVYQIGKVHAPGISDIDLVIVVEEGAFNDNISALSWENLTREQKYFFIHDPLIVTENIMKHLYEVIPVYSCKALFERVSLNMKRKQKRSKREILLNLLEIIVLYYPRNMVSLSLKKERNAREALCLLYLLGYNLAVSEKIVGVRKKEYDFFIEKISSLRKNWFILGKERFQLLDEAIDLGYKRSHDLVEDILKYIREKKIITLEKRKGEMCNTLCYFSKNISLIFKYNWDKEDALVEVYKIHKKTGIFSSVLPMEFYYIIFFLKREIKNEKEINSLCPVFLSSQLESEFSKKIKLLKEQFALYRKYAPLGYALNITLFSSFYESDGLSIIKKRVKQVIYFLFEKGFI
jgi:hypothetical protein